MKVELKWISVDDRLPDVGDEVLVRAEHTHYAFPPAMFVNKRSDNSPYTDDGITQELFFDCINEFVDEKAPHLSELSMYEKVKGVLLLQKTKQQ